MQSRIRFVAIPLLAAILVAAGTAVLLRPDGSELQDGRATSRGQSQTEANWIDSARSLAGLRGKSELVVVGHVTKIAPGPSTRSDSKEADAVTMPSQLITVAVDDVLKGAPTNPRPTSVVLTKTGDDKTWINDDPPYRVGDRYVLGLVARGDVANAYRPLGPDARLLIEGTNVGTWVDGSMRESLAQLRSTTAKTDVISILRSAR